MRVELRLLGEVEAVRDGRPLALGPARQQCVLVALATDANRTVPTARLLERVWADRPPGRSRATLAGYISRLRQALTGSPGVAILRRTGGYQLEIDPDSVDLYRFRRLVAQARTAAGARPLALLDEALGLWRGEPAATLDTPWLSGLRVALDAERRAAELDRNDLALAQGAHGALVGTLSDGVARDPLDERLAGQLMFALSRCGRQAEALQRYEWIRRRLAEELGTDPCPALRQVYLAILAGDATLTAGFGAAVADGQAAAVPGAAVTGAPRQLPAAAPVFIGRQRELDRLGAWHAQPEPTAPVVVVLCGTAGVGKTTLAVRWAHSVAASYPDGQLYVNLRGFDSGATAMRPQDALRGFLEALGVPAGWLPWGLDAQAALYRTKLAGKRMLVLLDNARDADQVRPLLPGTPGCVSGVTSRAVLAGLVAVDGAHPLTVGPLSSAEAQQLLARRLGPARVAAEPDVIAEIAEQCARLPLAMALVAARAAVRPDLPLAALAGQLRAGGGLPQAVRPLPFAVPAGGSRAA